VLLLAVSVGVTAYAEPEHPSQVDLCELLRHPERFKNRTVVVRGYILSTGIDEDGIGSPSCPRLGAVLEYTDNAASNGSVDRVFNAIMAAGGSTFDNRVVATAVGQFRWRKEFGSAIGMRVFTADLVTDVTVRPNAKSLQAPKTHGDK